MEQKNSLYIVIALAIGLTVGFLGGKSFVSGPLEGQIQKLRAQIDHAKSSFPPIPQDMRSISGIVKARNGNTITLEFFPSNPFDESPRTRIVTIAIETKLTHTKQKDQTAIDREAKEFQKLIQSQKPGTNLFAFFPALLHEVPATFSDIRVGQQVTVVAAENIRDAQSFTATQVTITSVSIPAGVPVQGGAPALGPR